MRANLLLAMVAGLGIDPQALIAQVVEGCDPTTVVLDLSRLPSTPPAPLGGDRFGLWSTLGELDPEEIVCQLEGWQAEARAGVLPLRGKDLRLDTYGQDLAQFTADVEALLAVYGPQAAALADGATPVPDPGAPGDTGWDLSCLGCHEYAAQCRCGGHGHEELPF